MPTQAEENAKDRALKERELKAKLEQEKTLTREKMATDFAKSLVPKGSFKLNDLGWYTKLAGTPKVNMELSTFVTGNVRDDSLEDDNINNGYLKNASPNTGVFQVNYVPTIGEQETVPDSSGGSLVITSNSSANDAISRLKSQLDKRNSRVSNYANDIIVRYTVGVIDGLYVPMKLLGLAIAFWDIAHAAYPEMAVQFVYALGFDPSNFGDNLPLYKDFYSKWSSQINESIPIFKDLSFLERRMFLAGKCLADSDHELAQVCVFHPVAIATFVDSDDLVRYTSMVMMQYGTFTNMIKRTFRAVTKGVSWRPFIRDLRGGVDDANFYKMPTDYESISPEVEIVDEVLSQLHNADCYPMVISDDPIFADNNAMLLMGSLTIRGDVKENAIQGLTADSFVNPSDASYWSDMLGQAAIVYRKFTVDDSTKRAAVVSGFKRLLNRGYNTKLINRYVLNVEGSTMIDTRLAAGFIAASCGSGGTISIYNGSVSVLGNESADTLADGVAVTPIRRGTETILNITRVPESSKIEELEQNGFTDQKWDGIFTGDAIAPGNFADIAEYFVSLVWSNWLFVFNDSGLGLDTTVYLNAKMTGANRIDWCPLQHVLYGNYSAAPFIYLVNGELDMYYVIAGEQLSRLNKQAAISEFTVDGSSILKPLS